MNFDEIKKLFPHAQQQNVNDGENFILHLTDGDAYLPKQELTSREKAIFMALGTQEKMGGRLTSWQLFLTKRGPQPQSERFMRFLYFKVDNLASSQIKEWENQILSFFAPHAASFWENDKNFVIVDEDCHLTQADLKGIIMTMDNDFLTKTHLLTGLIWKKENLLPAIFHEEEQIRDSNSWKNRIATVPGSALSFYTKSNNRQSVILTTYRTAFKENAGLEDLIHSLYQVGGNVSQAAKKMFIHRNTLEYRIDKIQQLYGLNLHQMDDLIFSYLLFV